MRYGIYIIYKSLFNFHWNYLAIAIWIQYLIFIIEAVIIFYNMIKALWLKIISLARRVMRDLNQRRAELVEYHDVHSSPLMCQARPSTLHIDRQSTVIRTVTSVVKQILNGASRSGVYALCVSWCILRHRATTNTIQRTPGIRVETHRFLLGAPITRLLLR